MPSAKRLAIDIPPGYASPEAASFVAQLDNLSERMERDTRGLTGEELSWQQVPGTNTIGMLLAHIAIWEVFWIMRALTDDPAAEEHVEDILGVGFNMPGMPMPPQGRPPLASMNEYPFFGDLLARARRHTTEVAQPLTDRDMERELEVASAGGSWIVTPRWTLYHILEHQAGHYGQILLLKQRMEHI